MLYWFRTPPGVRVGRAALDEDAIRLIEEHNPEIDFDWTQILRGVAEAPVELPPQPAGIRPQGRRQRQQRGRPEQGPSASGPPQAPVEDEAVEALPDAVTLENSTPEEAVPAEAAEELQATVEPLSLSATLDEYDATLTGGDPVPAGGADDFERPDAPPSAAAARLGPEGLLRLRARYAEVLARISERIADPVQQEQLKAQAERLNPDTWVTDQEVRDGLEQYEAVFDSLRAVVGRKRTRRRRRHHADGAQIGSAGSSGTD